MNMSLEQVIQIISIILFLSTGIGFFIKIGEYKSLINNEIKSLKNDVEDCKRDIEKLENKIETVENNNNHITSLLIEVKTKLEYFMTVSEIFKNNDKPKK